MGGCSQHKHMPSWLAHFLPRSTSPRWATQAQDTTAGPLYSPPLPRHIHAICMLTALWSTRRLNACYHGQSRTSGRNAPEISWAQCTARYSDWWRGQQRQKCSMGIKRNLWKCTGNEMIGKNIELMQLKVTFYC